MAVSSTGAANGAGTAGKTRLQRSRSLRCLQERLSGTTGARGRRQLRGQLQLVGPHLGDRRLRPGTQLPVR